MMARHRAILTLAAWLTAMATARAIDTVKTGKTSVAGEVTAMTSENVTVKTPQGDVVKPVNQITAIVFEGEPTQLNLARVAISSGRYEDALASLEKIDTGKIEKAFITQDIEFYKASCAGRLALRGTGAIRDAGRQMALFVNRNGNNYHWLQANELVGDLLVANGQFAAAEPYYGALAKTPWPEYQMRAGVAIGRAMLAQGKPAEAMKAFEQVIATEVKEQDTVGQTQRMLGELGKARCLAEGADKDAAIKLAQEIIAKADPENVAVQAQAYNTLGTALRKAGKPQEALLAFLHVDVLYFSSAEDHAEALANLAQLWNEVQKPERAAQALQTLKTRYKNSRWASQ
jgi:tetratricopeptide (TPR) repeat protein